MDGDDLAPRIEQAIAQGVVEDRSAAYDELLAGHVDLSPAELHKWLGEGLMKLWISDYYRLTEDEPDPSSTPLNRKLLILGHLRARILGLAPGYLGVRVAALDQLTFRRVGGRATPAA